MHPTKHMKIYRLRFALCEYKHPYHIGIILRNISLDLLLPVIVRIFSDMFYCIWLRKRSVGDK